jgi:hypothetical protein
VRGVDLSYLPITSVNTFTNVTLIWSCPSHAWRGQTSCPEVHLPRVWDGGTTNPLSLSPAVGTDPRQVRLHHRRPHQPRAARLASQRANHPHLDRRGRWPVQILLELVQLAIPIFAETQRSQRHWASRWRGDRKWSWSCRRRRRRDGDSRSRRRCWSFHDFPLTDRTGSLASSATTSAPGLLSHRSITIPRSSDRQELWA